MSDKTKRIAKLKFFAGLFVLLWTLSAVPNKAFASTLSLSPSSGSFEVESTFDVTVMLNTQGQTINAFEINLDFPANKMQVVAPSTGDSIATLWVSPPKYDNKAGTLQLQGGIVNGINTTGGNIATITFRAKAPGSASIAIGGDSEVLLHDGSGTSALNQINNAVFDLVMPPPKGPIVTAETHPDQSSWYNSTSVVFLWDPQGEDIEGYSYHLNDKALDDPDEVSEGKKTEKNYSELDDGKHYFHIKSMRYGVWGGTTNFAINIDSTPPAQFPIEVLPAKTGSKYQHVVEFSTTDSLSGIDHYDLRIAKLGRNDKEENETFFEATSPYVFSELETGSYRVTVRAYDRAGNFTESTKDFRISGSYLGTSITGIQMGGTFVLSWPWIIFLLLLIIFVLLLIIYYMHKKREQLEQQLKRLLEKLKKYKITH